MVLDPPPALAATAAFVVLATPFLVAWAWYRFARRDTPRGVALMGAVVVATAVESLSMVTLGLAGALAPWPCTLAHALLGAAAAVYAFTHRRTRALWSPEALRLRSYEVVLGVAVIVVGGLSAWMTLRTPTVNFDSLAYHLPALGVWVQAGRLVDLPLLGLQRYYAFGFEMLSLPLVVVLRSDVAAALPNLAGWVLLGLGTRALARQLGARRIPASAAAVLVLTAPLALGRMEAIQPDLFTGALFVAATASFVHFVREGRRNALVVAVLAAGLLPFFQASGWMYAGALVVGAAILVPRLSLPAPPASRAERGFGIAVLATVGVLASFWYLRNLALVGNPLGEFELRLLGTTLAHGSVTAEEVRRTTVAAAFRPTDAADWATAGRMLHAMLGPAYLLGVALGVVGGLVVAVRQWRRRWPRRVLVAVTVMTLLCLLAYLWMPYGADNGNRGYRLTDWSANALRYAMPLWGLVAALAAVGLSRLPGPRGVARWTAFALALFALARGGHDALGLREIDAWTVVAAGAVAGFLVWRLVRTIPVVPTGLALVVVLVVAVVAARAPREAARAEIYGPFFVDVERLVPADAPLAVFAVTRSYPLMGPRLRRPLVGIERPWHDRVRWRTDRGGWRETTRRWLGTLEARGVRHLVGRTRDPRPDRDGRGRDLHRLLLGRPGWRVLREARPPDHLILYERTGTAPAGP